MIEVGSAAVDITPPVGSRLAGQFEDRIAETIHDALYARALILNDGHTRVAIVSCDVLSLKRRTVLQARELAAARTGIPADHILICATHTHTGPMTANLFTRPTDADYVGMLGRQIAGAVALAAQSQQTAMLGVGRGREESASFNRRFLRPDGAAEMHPPKGAPGFTGPEGPNDPEVGVIVARDAEGRFLGTMVNYTSHPILVGRERAVSADYPGYLAAALRAAQRQQGEVLFVNGAFANVCPINVYDMRHQEYGYAWAERVGHVLAGEALRVLAACDLSGDAPLRAIGREIALQRRVVDDTQLSWAHDVLARGEQESLRERLYAGEVLLLAEEGKQAPDVPAEVQVIALGEAAIVGIPGELFVEFGLEIKRRSPFRATFIAGQANGCVGYVPTRRAFAGGGYETRLARSSQLVPEAGEQLVELAVALLEQVHATI